MLDPTKRIAYTVMETQRYENGEYMACVCVENQGGFYDYF